MSTEKAGGQAAERKLRPNVTFLQSEQASKREQSNEKEKLKI